MFSHALLTTNNDFFVDLSNRTIILRKLLKSKLRFNLKYTLFYQNKIIFLLFIYQLLSVKDRSADTREV